MAMFLQVIKTRKQFSNHLKVSLNKQQWLTLKYHSTSNSDFIEGYIKEVPEKFEILSTIFSKYENLLKKVLMFASQTGAEITIISFNLHNNKKETFHLQNMIVKPKVLREVQNQETQKTKVKLANHFPCKGLNLSIVDFWNLQSASLLEQHQHLFRKRTKVYHSPPATVRHDQESLQILRAFALVFIQYPWNIISKIKGLKVQSSLIQNTTNVKSK